MEAYIKEANSETPSIILNPSDKMYSISGQSFPEDVNKIYLPVIEWFKSNAELIDHKICLKVDFDYINSATSKILMDVFTVLEELTKTKSMKLKSIGFMMRMTQIIWIKDASMRSC